MANNTRGELTMYRRHDAGEQYVIGADTAMGVSGGDWSVAQVLTRRNDRWQLGVVEYTQILAEILNGLGHFFNTAYIIVETWSRSTYVYTSW